MARRRTGRFGAILALLIALGGALIVGGALAITRPFAPQVAQAAPTASRQSAQFAIIAVATPSAAATATATASGPISAQPAASSTIGTTPTVLSAPTVAITARPRTPTPPPAAWTVIGRWQADQLIITEPFSTRGPWRLCWSQPDARIPFQVMVGNPEQTAWDLLSAPTGATTGAFDLAQGGSYRLMFHSETSYTALVVAKSSDSDAEPPPCG
jgi:hypothetical protein